MIQNWDRLRIFDAVATHGSVRAAAEEPGVSGSAVSQQIRRLERESGQRLIEPSGRGIRLTPAGTALARHSRAVGSIIQEAEDELGRLSGEIAGRLRIGGLLSAARMLLGPALARMTAHHPKVEPVIIDGEAGDFVEMLAARQLDVALIESWPSNAFTGLSSLATLPIMDEPVDLVVSAALEPAPRRLEDVAHLPWVVCPQGSGAYQTVTDRLRRAGLEPDIRYQIGSYASQLDLVANGLAVALVPRLARSATERRGIAFIALDPPLARRLYLVTRHGEERLVIETFTAELLSQRDEAGYHLRPAPRLDPAPRGASFQP